MLRIFLGVTHRPWFHFLEALKPDEVNFWQPSGAGEFKALRPGDLFLFKLKGKEPAIAGGGVFSHASLAPLSLAWTAFGQKNGNLTLTDMRETIAALRHEKAPLGLHEDPVIGCRILTDPFFWPRDLWIPVPDSFKRNTVVGKSYSTEEEDGQALWAAIQERTKEALHSSSVRAERYGAPVLMKPRLGQGAFRLVVTDGYARRCAVSGERTLPILDAAHIRSYAEGGAHDLANGLLLRTDIHRLFDLGYVTVTESRRFAVSERLKADFDNGAHYYAIQGREIARPRRGFAPPSDEALRWHRDNRYRG